MQEVQKALEALAAELPPPPLRQESEGSAAIDVAQIAGLVMPSTLGKASSETRQPRRAEHAHGWACRRGGWRPAWLPRWIRRSGPQNRLRPS